MNEFRRCKNTWMYCDGNCGRCVTVVTTSTTMPVRVEYITTDNKTYFPTGETAHWMWNTELRCSRCNYKLESTGLPSICPNCGAQMMETKNDNT